jgi:predicted ArsR family transcriptional regulator
MGVTPDRIRQYILSHGPSSAKELSLALRLTLPNIRHHLEHMLAGGWIEVAGQRPAKARGRPTTLYALRSAMQPNNFIQLADVLLQETLSSLSSEQRKAFLHGVAQRMAKANGRPPQKLTPRLNQIVLFLNQMHYQARWEAHAEGPRIFFGNCPYAALLPEHPELCVMDAYLLEALLGTGVELTTRQTPGAPLPNWCIFSCHSYGIEI